MKNCFILVCKIGMHLKAHSLYKVKGQHCLEILILTIGHNYDILKQFTY